ncbi:MAG: hypothetical protein QOE70_1588 [Chthoniobacter sp.]|nr:hypothetical protein [Chthoniobacter sp.]
MPRPKKTTPRATQPRQPVIGLEAEFSLFVRDELHKPEHIFRKPEAVVRQPTLPRSGRARHLPSGGALYFDTGVIEVATPIIEIEAGCCIRAGRSLWEQIAFLRGELDAWEQRENSHLRLQGFSAHYNVSVPTERGLDEQGVRQLALLLTYILPAPVMLLAANRLSTGVGVRPRGDRLEVTVDFTPDPDLLIAAVSLAIGVILGVLRWPSHSLDELERRKIPVIAGFKPRKHTSRKGWLARADCFPRNPFAADPNAADWLTRDGRTLSLRQMARTIARPFRKDIRAVSDADAFEHVFAVFDERARSLLDFSERPPRYDDVGRTIDWNRRSTRVLPRSAYERVIHRILEHRPLRIGNATYRPERMQGWYEIVFRNTGPGCVRSSTSTTSSGTASSRAGVPATRKWGRRPACHECGSRPGCPVRCRRDARTTTDRRGRLPHF